MHLGSLVRSRRFGITLVTVGLGLLAIAALSARLGPTPASPAVAICDTGSMSAANMARLSADHFAANPAHGSPVVYTSTTAVPADTFMVRDYEFDADHNTGTQNDVVHISAGQSVMFKWVNDYHSTTSGNPDDLDAGSLWSYAVDPAHTEVVLTFPTPGTYPFFCIFHGADFNMTGTIVVTAATPTNASTWGTIKARYR